MSDINCRMPAVALRGLVCLPDMILHFDVSRKKSIAALEAAMVKDQMVFLVAQKDPDEELYWIQPYGEENQEPIVITVYKK